MQFELVLTPTQQKIAAIGLALIPLLAFGGVAASLLMTQVHRHEQVSLLVRQLARERAILVQAPSWIEKLSHVRSSADWQGLYVNKMLPGQTGAASALITQAGGKVEQDSAKRLPTSGATEIDETVVFGTTTEQLAHILAALGGRKPVFVIRSITITSAEETAPNPRTAPNMLHVELTVAEFERP